MASRRRRRHSDALMTRPKKMFVVARLFVPARMVVWKCGMPVTQPVSPLGALSWHPPNIPKIFLGAKLGTNLYFVNRFEWSSWHSQSVVKQKFRVRILVQKFFFLLIGGVREKVHSADLGGGADPGRSDAPPQWECTPRALVLDQEPLCKNARITLHQPRIKNLGAKVLGASH